MDLIAAVALVLVIEGLAIAVFAGTLPELVATLQSIGEDQCRWLGWAMTALGALVYIFVRG